MKNGEVIFGVQWTVLLGTQDMVNVPGKFSAMENWGLSMYNREAILFDQVQGIRTILVNSLTCRERTMWRRSGM